MHEKYQALFVPKSNAGVLNGHHSGRNKLNEDRNSN